MKRGASALAAFFLRALPALTLALCAQAGSAQDYLPQALRAQVAALAVDARRTPSNAANAEARAHALWKWLNAYASTGRHMPVDAAAAVAAALADPGAEAGNRRLDLAIAALALLDEQPDALGSLAAEGGPFQAGGFATIRQTYTVGAKAIEPGGGFIVARPALPGLGWYQTEDASADNYLSIAASDPSVRFATAAPPFGAATGTLMFRLASGRLGPGDTATISYGDAGGGARGLRMPDAATAYLPLHIVFDGGGAPVDLPVQPLAGSGAAVAGVRGFAPSVVATGETFALSIRAEDAHRNRASGPIPRRSRPTNAASRRSTIRAASSTCASTSSRSCSSSSTSKWPSCSRGRCRSAPSGCSASGR